MADALDLLRAALTAPGQHHEADLAAMQAAITVLEQLGEGTVEWGVRYEMLPAAGGWMAVEVECADRDDAVERVRFRQGQPNRYRNVEVVSRRRYVTDWQPVEPQP